MSAAGHGSALRRVTLLVIGVGIVLGGVAAPVWHGLVTLPTYVVGEDGSATTTEQGLTQVFSTDAWFCLIGSVVGVLVGVLAWVLMRRRGAWSVLAAAVSSCAGAGVCWWIGVLIGPDSFAQRVASAKAGDVVPVDFELHTWVSVLVWLVAAMVPLFVGALVNGPRMAAPADREEDRPAGETTAAVPTPVGPDLGP